ncbi:unnamed protein product [Protopolystoma xenopodis]|uniref:Uncharacterized protein n=1 Tax=Protopolystoma xenopodis TaxID=117903 RepID=A0A3S5AXV8_9PLAT|nr:unnamed protein product [Protopolystoma xenopodis]
MNQYDGSFSSRLFILLSDLLVYATPSESSDSIFSSTVHMRHRQRPRPSSRHLHSVFRPWSATSMTRTNITSPPVDLSSPSLSNDSPLESPQYEAPPAHRILPSPSYLHPSFIRSFRSPIQNFAGLEARTEASQHHYPLAYSSQCIWPSCMPEDSHFDRLPQRLSATVALPLHHCIVEPWCHLPPFWLSSKEDKMNVNSFHISPHRFDQALAVSSGSGSYFGYRE